MKQKILTILWLLCTLPMTAQNEELNARLGNTGQITVKRLESGTDAETEIIVSENTSIMGYFSLMQPTASDGSAYPLLMTISLTASQQNPDEQTAAVAALNRIGWESAGTGFPHHGSFTLENGDTYEGDFALIRQEPGAATCTATLCVGLLDAQDRKNASEYLRRALLVRRYDIVSITIAGHTLWLRELGYHTAVQFDRLARELLNAGCPGNTVGIDEIRSPYESQLLLDERPRTLQELLDRPLGILPAGIYCLQQPIVETLVRLYTHWNMKNKGMLKGYDFFSCDNALRYDKSQIGVGLHYTTGVPDCIHGYGYEFPKSKKGQLMKDFKALGIQLRKPTDADNVRQYKGNQYLVGRYGNAMIEIEISYKVVMQVYPEYYK